MSLAALIGRLGFLMRGCAQARRNPCDLDRRGTEDLVQVHGVRHPSATVAFFLLRGARSIAAGLRPPRRGVLLPGSAPRSAPAPAPASAPASAVLAPASSAMPRLPWGLFFNLHVCLLNCNHRCWWLLSLHMLHEGLLQRRAAEWKDRLQRRRRGLRELQGLQKWDWRCFARHRWRGWQATGLQEWSDLCPMGCTGSASAAFLHCRELHLRWWHLLPKHALVVHYVKKCFN
mmetsp:Transcript_5477/g.12670  ORF Transcript_5477/g.12670 Transcript_5477/m.12670 type:complete len:231 (+) Transcript_5477:304-996(+)